VAAAGLSAAGSAVVCSRPYWSFHNAMTSLLLESSGGK
jgi:hypothetical protein